MAKRIISDGTDTYRATCDECGCVFTYERGDVHHNYMHSADHVSCPQCGHGCRHLGAQGSPARRTWGRGGYCMGRSSS